MLRDITLGQYYPADSVVHKLDPRVKLFAIYHCIIYISRNSWIGFDHRNADFYD